MVETYKNQPFEERPSQKLGWKDYLKEVAIGLIPFATAGAAVAFGKFTKQSIRPLDGSPDIISSIWMKILNKTAKNAGSTTRELKQTDWVWWLTIGYSNPEDKLRLSKHYFNAFKGFEFGLIPVVFHHWRKKEKNRLDLTSTYESLKEVNKLKPSDDELKAENASLKQQLEFMRDRPTNAVEASASDHHGTVAASGHTREF